MYEKLSRYEKDGLVNCEGFFKELRDILPNGSAIPFPHGQLSPRQVVVSENAIKALQRGTLTIAVKETIDFIQNYGDNNREIYYEEYAVLNCILSVYEGGGIMLNPVIHHSLGVAEYMRDHAKINPDGMYVLGLLHDIGKLYGFENHEKVGAEILSGVGFSYAKEVELHGKPQDDYSSYALDLLNSADLSVNPAGEYVGHRSRLYNIGMRYGFESEQYMNAKTLSKKLIEKGFLEE